MFMKWDSLVFKWKAIILFYDNISEYGGYYIKGNKSDMERLILYD